VRKLFSVESALSFEPGGWFAVQKEKKQYNPISVGDSIGGDGSVRGGFLHLGSGYL
jgi:hypothetical protein